MNLTERKIAGYQGTLSHRTGALVFGYNYQKQSGVLSGVAASRDQQWVLREFARETGFAHLPERRSALEHSSAFGTIWSGRGGASFPWHGEHGALSSVSLRASAGRGVTEPSLLENFAVSAYYHGNPALRPETTTSYEAGIVGDWFHRRVRTEVAAFRSSFQDLIAFVGDSWQNIEASWARGVETSAEARLPHSLPLTGTYMRLYTRVTASTRRRTPPLKSARNWCAGREILARCRSRYARSDGPSSPAGDSSENDRTPISLSASRAIPAYREHLRQRIVRVTGHVTPVLRVDNLLNERYEEVLGYQALSRSMLGGMRVHW